LAGPRPSFLDVLAGELWIRLGFLIDGVDGFF